MEKCKKGELKMKKNILAVLIVILLIISGVLIYKKINGKKLPPYLVEAVGVVDGDLINLNTKYPGRIIALNIDTGDKVKKGEIIARLDDKEYIKKLDALNFEIKAKEDELNFTTAKILKNIEIAKNAYIAKKNELNALNADIDALKKIIDQDKRDENRIAVLVKRKIEKHHKLELAQLKTNTDIDKLKALIAKKDALNKEIEIYKQKYEIALKARENIKALKNAINALKQKRDEVKVVLNELKIQSPISGYVDTKIANIGEVLGAGMPIATLINPKSLYLKIYVNTIYTGKIKLGDKAEIFLDAYPNRPIKAVVSKIAKKAEFTPKEVAVRADRITRVYEVRLKPLKPNPLLKLGLPATGVVLIGNGKLPKSLNELPEL